MYLFQISNYDDPAVDRETAELLHQRLEAESRRRCPAMWNVIDRIRIHAAKGPIRRGGGRRMGSTPQQQRCRRQKRGQEHQPG